MAEPQRFPRITIAVPSFNQGAFIRETLQCLVDQGYPDLEYVIVDGGSSAVPSCAPQPTASPRASRTAGRTLSARIS